MTDTAPRRPLPSLVALALAITTVFAAALVGNLATIPNIAPWYEGLAKPWFNPPNWVFGPAWTALYALMTVAFWRILRIAPGTPGRAPAIGWFLVQIVLNALWSVTFFGAHSPLGGIVVIGALIVAIASTLLAFSKLDRIAEWLLIPYLAWVSFATVLNIAIWKLN
jgi:translocator protein